MESRRHDASLEKAAKYGRRGRINSLHGRATFMYQLTEQHILCMISVRELATRKPRARFSCDSQECSSADKNSTTFHASCIVAFIQLKFQLPRVFMHPTDRIWRVVLRIAENLSFPSSFILN